MLAHYAYISGKLKSEKFLEFSAKFLNNVEISPENVKIIFSVCACVYVYGGLLLTLKIVFAAKFIEKSLEIFASTRC